MNEPIEMQASSGNVFADLGLPNPDEMLVKAELMRQIGQIVEQRTLTESQTAKLLATDAAEVAALLKGRIAEFSTERLFYFLNALDRDVEISVKPKSRTHPSARTTVVQG